MSLAKVYECGDLFVEILLWLLNSLIPVKTNSVITVIVISTRIQIFAGVNLLSLFMI